MQLRREKHADEKQGKQVDALGLVRHFACIQAPYEVNSTPLGPSGDTSKAFRYD